MGRKKTKIVEFKEHPETVRHREIIRKKKQERESYSSGALLV